jgi:hypothetical protein
MAWSSPTGSDSPPPKFSSTGSVATTRSTTCSPRWPPRPETARSSAFTERFAGVPHREGFPLARRSAARTRRQNRGLQHRATESHLRRDPWDASTEGVQIQGLLVRNRNGSFQNALLDQAHNRIQDRANGPSRRDRHLDPPFATDLPHRVSLLGSARTS